MWLVPLGLLPAAAGLGGGLDERGSAAAWVGTLIFCFGVAAGAGVLPPLRLLLPLLLLLPLPLPAAVPPEDLSFGLELDEGGAPTAGDDGALEAPSRSGALEHMAHCLHLQ